MGGACSWPARRLRGLAVVVATCSWIGFAAPRSGHADEYIPPEAAFQAPLGWNCWSRATVGDFDADGRIDRAFFWQPAARGERCDEFRPPRRTRLTVFLATDDLVERALACDAWFLCDVQATNFDRDRRAELLASWTGGLTGRDAVPLVLRKGRLRRAKLLGPVRRGSGLHAGFVAWNGDDLRNQGKWRFVRTRLAFDGRTFHVVGSRTYRERTDPTDVQDVPRLPTVEPCTWRLEGPTEALRLRK